MNSARSWSQDAAVVIVPLAWIVPAAAYLAIRPMVLALRACRIRGGDPGPKALAAPPAGMPTAPLLTLCYREAWAAMARVVAR